MSSKFGWYIGSASRIYPVNFQVRTQKVKVTVRQNRKWESVLNLQMARYTLNNSSIHPTYFLLTRQKAKTSLIHVPGRFDQILGCNATKSQDIVNPCPRTFRPNTRLMKANKGQRRSTMHNTLHHHTPQYIQQISLVRIHVAGHPMLA